MKRLRILVGTGMVLGFVSAVALFAEYLALADIAKVSEPVSEWKVVMICMLVVLVCLSFMIFTLGYVLVHDVSA